jgi:hypothetical protein
MDEIRALYWAWSGTIRNTIVTNVGNYENIVLGAVPTFAESFNTSYDASVHEFQNYEKFYNGFNVWKPGLESSKVISVPFYSQVPMLRNPIATDGKTPITTYTSQNVAFLDILMQYTRPANTESGVPPDMAITVFQSAGDDFKLYFPLDIPTQIFPTVSITPRGYPKGKTVESEVDEMGGYVKDLTLDGDVEANPGPVDLTDGQIEQELTDLLDDMHALGDLSPCAAFGKIWKWVASWVEKRASASTMDRIKTRLQSIHDVIVGKIIPVVVWALDFCLNIHLIFSNESTFVKALALTSLTAKCIMSYKHGITLLEQLKGTTEGTQHISRITICRGNSSRTSCGKGNFILNHRQL